ncbi:hypothetical protein CK203_057472 [Vitis vinifera]|uniref:Uncharacterized protein n=1 Tax=Vitis vinifera TaxID=29760 RepID=A0A438GLA8_VITVI|nr:hypothetical protein CK203_114611 [Vitis vinifera]RVW73000.1 hypothetical protein CK203_057472 [Vitis vinifera]
MVNSEDDAILGKDFFLQLHDLTDDDVDKVVDVSKLPLLDMLEILNQHTYLTERVMKDKYKKTLKLLVVSGDAKANRLLQLINNLKIDPKPPIAILSLGSQTNFSLSLGWVR